MVSPIPANPISRSPHQATSSNLNPPSTPKSASRPPHALRSSPGQLSLHNYRKLQSSPESVVSSRTPGRTLKRKGKASNLTDTSTFSSSKPAQRRQEPALRSNSPLDLSPTPLSRSERSQQRRETSQQVSPHLEPSSIPLSKHGEPQRLRTSAHQASPDLQLSPILLFESELADLQVPGSNLDRPSKLFHAFHITSFRPIISP